MAEQTYTSTPVTPPEAGRGEVGGMGLDVHAAFEKALLACIDYCGSMIDAANERERVAVKEAERLAAELAQERTDKSAVLNQLAQLKRELARPVGGTA